MHRQTQGEDAMPDATASDAERLVPRTITRRRFIKGGAAAVAGLGALRAGPARGAEREIKIGYVSPRTGPLAGFGEADEFILAGLEQAFKWTSPFFWGLEDIIGVFSDLWQTVPTNKKVGALWPNDGDGRAWGDPERGFAPALKKLGFEMVDPGFFKPLLDDFSAQITAFKNAKVEIVTGVLIPPDFTTFWTQARQQGFRPKAVTVGKALLFPRSVEALGAIGEGLTTEVWWSPNHPFKSSLTGASARDLAAAYTNATKKQWTQPMGFIHALFEVAFDALSRSGKAGDREALREAIKATTKKTIVGDISWAKGPVGNVAKTPLVGGQWGKGKQFAYDLTIVNNKRAPFIPTSGTLRGMV